MNKILTTSVQELRKFGITIGILIVLFFGLLIPWVFNINTPQWPWLLSALFILSATLFPSKLKFVYFAWMKFALVLAWINSRIILAVMFYLMFFPMAILMKIVAYDPLNKKIEKNTVSYRVKSLERKKDHIERPF